MEYKCNYSLKKSLSLKSLFQWENAQKYGNLQFSSLFLETTIHCNYNSTSFRVCVYQLCTCIGKVSNARPQKVVFSNF